MDGLERWLNREETLPAKPEDLSWIPVTHVTEGEKQLR